MSKVQNGVSLEHALREILNAAGINDLKAVLSQTASAAREAPETSTDPQLQNLKILLQAIECNREIVKSLKGLLAQNESQKAALLELMKVIEDKMPEALQKNSVPVFTEKVLRSPQKLAEILSDSNALKYKVLLQLLQGFQIETQSCASSSASEKSLAVIQSKIANLVEIHREVDSQPGRIENPIQKLVGILSSMPQASRELLAKGEKLLETMLRAHLDSIKLIEKDIQGAIEPAFADNPIETLLATLGRTEKVIKEAKTDIEQKFLNFVSTLRENLENCSDKDPAKLQNVSDVLKRSLETLERDIKPVIYASLKKSEEQINETVPRKVLSLLRSIEIQLRTLSAMPDNVLRDFVRELRTEQQGAGQQIVKHMEALFKELRSVEVPVANAVKEGFRKEIEKLEASLGKLMKVDIEPQQFRHALKEIQTQLKEVPEFFQKVVLMERESAFVLPSSFLKDLSSIENSLKLLLQQISQAIPQTAQEFSQNPVFKQLLEELTRILKFELPENDFPMIQAVKRIIKDIGEKLELHVQKGSPPTVLKEVLQDALKQVEKSLYSQKASQGDLVLEDLKFATGRLNANTEIGDPEVLLSPGINILPKANRENSAEINRPLLFENLRRLEKQIRETIKLLEQFREGVPKYSEMSGQPQMPSPLQSQNIDKSLVQESILRELGTYREQELLQALKPGLQHIDRQEQRLLLLKDPVILSLLKEIRLIDLTHIAGNSHEEKQFLEFLKQMSKEVPMKEARSSNENFARKDLEEGLARLEQQFRSEQSRPIDPKELQLRNLVSSIEQLMKGHEFLDRVNTLMNMLGEPALMLFPSLVHGFASQLELLSYPNPKNSEVEEDDTGNSKHRKKQAYKRFEFDMNFAGIGRIQTRAYFRDGEFLLDLCVENNSIAEFVNHRLSKFEAFLHLQGYEKTELHISVAPFSEMTPSWVPMLLGAASNNETI